MEVNNSTTARWRGEKTGEAGGLTTGMICGLSLFVCATVRAVAVGKRLGGPAPDSLSGTMLSPNSPESAAPHSPTGPL